MRRKNKRRTRRRRRRTKSQRMKTFGGRMMTEEEKEQKFGGGGQGKHNFMLITSQHWRCRHLPPPHECCHMFSPITSLYLLLVSLHNMNSNFRRRSRYFSTSSFFSSWTVSHRTHPSCQTLPGSTDESRLHTEIPRH